MYLLRQLRMENNVEYCTVSYHMALSRIVSYRTVLHRIIAYRIELSHLVSYSIVSYCILSFLRCVTHTAVLKFMKIINKKGSNIPVFKEYFNITKNKTA